MKGKAQSIFLIILLVTLCSCNQTDKKPNPEIKKYGKNDVFYAKELGFALHEVVLEPEYNTAAQNGYGIIFYMKKGTAPVLIQGGAYRSLVDLAIYFNEEERKSTEIGFSALNDDPDFKGKAIFYFRIGDDEEFPKRGVFKYNAAAESENMSFEIDLSQLIIPDKQ